MRNASQLLHALAITAGLSAFTGAPTALAAQSTLGPRTPASEVSTRRPKSPNTARVLGILPGLGHLYAEEPGRAGAILGTVVGIVLLSASFDTECDNPYSDEYCGSPVVSALVAGAIVGVIGFSVWDAGRAAHRTNLRNRIFGRVVLSSDPGPLGGRRFTLRVNLPVENFGGL